MFDFARVISPTPPEDFFRDFWERQPFHVERGNPAYYRELLGATDLDSLLSHARPEVVERGATFLRLEANGGGKAIAATEARQAYASGKTVILQNVQRCFPEIAAFCRELEFERKCQVLGNLFLTPPHTQGFGVHYDTRDVFAVQLEGVKHWRLFGAGPELPLPDEPLVELPIGTRLDPVREVVLRAGDVLYVPRGHFHEVVASDLPSVHISMTVIQTRWLSLLIESLSQVARKDVRFRKGINPAVLGDSIPAEDRELFGELVRALGEAMTLDDAARTVARQFSKAEAIPQGQLHG